MPTKFYIFVFASIIVNFVGITLTQARDGVENIIIDRESTPDPLVIAGVSGGSLEATEVLETEATTTGFCDGFINRQPNHRLILNSFFDFLRVEVESNVDTTIMIEGPGGIWCNDDTNDTNPVIEGQWQPGSYKIWIGSHQVDVFNDYLIKITGIKTKL
ncbi:hypothetical protein IQ238_26070 [Pleurocapsales cyanobacterium LEGE 06147]|nr:hypothetical protein [Pleurocapsales cyanobacterium LEGE 06147]